MQRIKDYIYYNRKEIITVIVCLISFFTFTIFNKKEETIVLEQNIEKKEEKETVESNIMVDIKGEVENPGTYEFESGKRIIDVIEKSGGLTKNADTNSINLSEKLEDEMFIYIPSKNNENTIQEKNSNTVVNNTNSIKDERISINTASVSELMSIKGIGEKKAEAIVSYRKQNGLFKKIEDIVNVSGIGNSLFDKIKDFIKV